MNIISGTAGSLLNTYRQLAAYRHKVFVEHLGWDLHAPDGPEQDQFDRPDTVYVVARDDEGEVCGCARLLPTTRPYLLSEVFPQLLNGTVPPNSPEIWELSRFATVDFGKPGKSPSRQMSSDITLGTATFRRGLCGETGGETPDHRVSARHRTTATQHRIQSTPCRTTHAS